MHKTHNSAMVIFELFSLIICNAMSCLPYSLVTVRVLSTELHSFVMHIQTTCHTGEP